MYCPNITPEILEEEKWRIQAVEKLWKEREEMGHTPLVKFQARFPNVDIFLKNETATKTHTLKHRFAWALVMWMIIDGKGFSNAHPGQFPSLNPRLQANSKSTIYDSTSGNTGASEAYMCTLVGLPFTAVVSKELEPQKVDSALRNFHAQNEAEKNNGFFLNQFGNAKYAEEFHESGNYSLESSNVFHEILEQLREDEAQEKKIPDYFVHSAGTGGTISSVGRYTKRYNIPTRIVLSDSEYSLLYDYTLYNKFTNESGTKIWKAPGIAGIGYGYNVKPVIYGETTSLLPSVVDEAMKMPDIASVAAMHVLRERGIGGGASTALNFLVSLHKAYQLKDSKDISGRLTIVTIICDPAEYYETTYFNPEWINKMFPEKGGMKGLECWKDVINKSIDTGSDFLEEGLASCPNTGARFRRSLSP
ncbi:pyridoxal-phosphate dependent protein [Oesophagostomum dentatum]|uniref:Pyridoxal-phosphate dependent protein n=1 Tax=Oesophagostomum dentatum TaxID=61180 RepID=A0A0B1TBH8_OESDE|nr:pyridoxal-phosphate dependent protein [Oesophagostomum dentatum]